VNISILTYYEIVSGLKHRDAHQQMATFLAFSSQSNIVPLTEPSVMLAAHIYADLRAAGMPLDDIDLLIAGSALVNDWILVTHNTKHFERIEGLQLMRGADLYGLWLLGRRSQNHAYAPADRRWLTARGRQDAVVLGVPC